MMPILLYNKMSHDRSNQNCTMKFLLPLLLSCVILTLRAREMASVNMKLTMDRFLMYKQQSYETCYGVEMDAGSSGTRVYVYKWPCRQTSIAPRLDISSDTPNLRVAPGLSTFNTNLDGVKAYLDGLMVFVNQTVTDVNQRQYVPVFVRATAGMRLLTMTDQTAILTRVRSLLAVSGYRFASPDWAQVIDGSHEGVYGFIATNYLLGNINSNTDPSNTAITLDVGGASAQITFVPSTAPPSNNFTLVIPGVPRYHLYTYSFLGFGGDAARNATFYKFLPSNGQIMYPCFFTGYSEVRSRDSVVINGTGNFVECQAVIRDIFNLGSDPTTTINGVYLAPIVRSQTISGIGIFNTLGVTLGLVSFSVDQL
jgi:apyrase